MGIGTKNVGAVTDVCDSRGATLILKDSERYVAEHVVESKPPEFQVSPV